MVSYSQVRSPISIILFIGSFALFGATGYLIYRTIHEYESRSLIQLLTVGTTYTTTTRFIHAKQQK